MPRLTPVSFNEFVKKFRKFGFEGPHPGGKHLYMTKENLRLTLPNPHRKQIGVELLARILKQADIKREEWLRED